MTNALTVQNSGAVTAVDMFDREKIDLIKRTVAKGVTDDELALFLHQAQRAGLDPLAKQIHAVTRWDNKQNRQVMSIQVAIDGYRLIADRTGLYAGSDDYLFNEGLTQYQHLQVGGTPVTATVTVYKIVAGHRVPFTATAAWDAYFPGPKQGFMWGKMPHLMLGKCAEALALRKAFPAELSGMYVREEMEQAGFIDTPTDQPKIVDDAYIESDAGGAGDMYPGSLPVQANANGFKKGDEVLVVGKDDEVLGTYQGTIQNAKKRGTVLYTVTIDGTDFNVSPDKVKAARAEAPDQRPLFGVDTAVSDGAYNEA